MCYRFLIGDLVERRTGQKPLADRANLSRLPKLSGDVVRQTARRHSAKPPVLVKLQAPVTDAAQFVCLFEYRVEDPDVPIKRLHRMSVDQARKEMAAVGLVWQETKDFLPQQHFIVYQKPR